MRIDFEALKSAIAESKEEDARYIGLRVEFNSMTNPEWGTVIERHPWMHKDGPMWCVQMDNDGVWLAWQRGLDYQIKRNAKAGA